MDNMIPQIAKDVLNNIAGQLLILILIIAVAYAVPYLILSFIRVPTVFKNVLSTAVMLLAMYYSFDIIFLM